MTYIGPNIYTVYCTVMWSALCTCCIVVIYMEYGVLAVIGRILKVVFTGCMVALHSPPYIYVHIVLLGTAGFWGTR